MQAKGCCKSFTWRPACESHVAKLPRPRDFAPAVIPSVHPLLNCRPTITVGETFHLIQNAGQELGAINSDLAKRGRRVALRRLCGVAPVLISAKSPTLAPFHFRSLSGGLSRRTASALHGPWPRLIERSGATISGAIFEKTMTARIATSGTPRDVAARRRGAVGESEASQRQRYPRFRPSCRTCCAHDQTNSDSDGGSAI